MDCRVCNGSGVSPASRTRAAQRIGFIVECGACGGTGIDRRSYAAPEPEPEPGTGALESAASFQHHLDAILGRRDEPGGGEDYAAMSGIELMFARGRIDSRYMVELPNTIIGRTNPETAANLEAIAVDYRRLAAQSAAHERAALEKKAADATRSLAAARENLGDHAAARRAYEEAKQEYERLGAEADARKCADDLFRLDLHGGRDVDLAFGTLHTRLDAATDPLDRAEQQLDLAELHLSRGDDFEAESLLRDAERVLTPLVPHAGGAATADALVRSLSQLLEPGAGPGAGGIGIEETMRIRALLSRLYRGMIRVAPNKASDYLDRLTELEGSTAEGSRDNAEFSDRMRSALDGLLEQLHRRPGEP